MTDPGPATQEADESQGDLIWRLIHSNYPRAGGLSTASTDSNTTTDGDGGESQRVPPLPDSLPASAVPVPYETHGLAGESNVLGGSGTGAGGGSSLAHPLSMDPLGQTVTMVSLTQPPPPGIPSLSQLRSSAATIASSGPPMPNTATSSSGGPSKGSSSSATASKSQFKVPGAPSSASSLSTPKPPTQSAHASSSSSRVLTRSSAPIRASPRRPESQDSFGQTTASQDARRALEEHGDTLVRLIEEASTGADESRSSMYSRHNQASPESSQTQSSSSGDHSREIVAGDVGRLRGDVLVVGTQSPAQSQQHSGGGGGGGGGGEEESQGLHEGQSSQVYYDDASLFDRIPSQQASAPVEPPVQSSPYDVPSDHSQEVLEATQMDESVFAAQSMNGTIGTVGTMNTVGSESTGLSTGTGLSLRQTNFLAQSNPTRHRRAVNEEAFRNAIPYTFDPFMHSSSRGSRSDDHRETTPPPPPQEPETQLVSPPRPRTRRQLPSAQSLRSTSTTTSVVPPKPTPAPQPPSPSTQHAAVGPSQPSQRSTFPNSSSSVIPGSVSSERSVHPQHDFLVGQATQTPTRPGGGEVLEDSQESVPAGEEEAPSSQPVPLAVVLGNAKRRVQAVEKGKGKEKGKGRQEESGDADAESSQSTPIAPRRKEPSPVKDDDDTPLDADMGMIMEQPRRDLEPEDSGHSSLGPKRQEVAKRTYGRGRGAAKGGRGRGGGRTGKAPAVEETTPKKASRQTKITDTIKTSPGKKSPTKLLPTASPSPVKAMTPLRSSSAADITSVTTPGNDTSLTPIAIKRRFVGEEDLTSPSSGGMLSPEYMRGGRSPTVENVESPMEIEQEEDVVEVVPPPPPTQPSPRKTRRKLGAQPQVSIEAFSEPSRGTRRTRGTDESSSSEDDNSGSYQDSQPVWMTKPSSSGIRIPRARMSREATAESSSTRNSMPPPPAPSRNMKRRRPSDSQPTQSQRMTKRQRLDSASQAQQRPRLPAVFAHYAADKHFYAAWVTGSLGGHGAKHKYAVVYADGSSAEVTLANLRPGPIVGTEVLVHRAKKWTKATLVGFDADAATVRGSNGDEDDGIDDNVGWPTVRRNRAMVGDATLDEDGIRALIERHTLAEDDGGGDVVTAAPLSRGHSSASMPLSRHVSSTSASTHRTGTQSDKLAAYAVLITSKNNDDWRQSLTDRLLNAGAIVIHDWADVLSFGGDDEKTWSAVAGDFRLRGVVGEDEDDEEEAVPARARRLLVLSNTDVQTPKYLIALALGVPCIHYSWALDVLRGNAETDDWSSYLLIAGTSDRIGSQGMSQFVRSPMGVRLQDLLCEPDAEDTWTSRRRKPFANKRVLLIGDPIIPVRQEDGWDLGGSRCFPQVCLAMGAAVVDMVTGPGSIPRDRSFDIMIYGEARNNSLTSTTELKRLKKRFSDCHVGSANWLKQCLISGSIVTPTT